MSLYALPVSASDLLTLQQGITFTTNNSEATSEAALINGGSDTVANYANTLFGRQISLHQVAMLVDTLMNNNSTDTISEMQNLVLNFLPGQVANAIANGYNPTVYASEALGLGLANYRVFWSTFGTSVFGDAEFETILSSITGVNQSAIAGWLSNWTTFYTNHPQTGLTTAQAARGATFGDACGVVLTNPTANSTIINLNAGVKNAIFCEAQGIYTVNSTLGGEPTAQAFQH